MFVLCDILLPVSILTLSRPIICLYFIMCSRPGCDSNATCIPNRKSLPCKVFLMYLRNLFFFILDNLLWYNETHWSGESFRIYEMLRTFYWTFVVAELHAHFHRTSGQTKTTCTFLYIQVNVKICKHFSSWRNFSNAEVGISNSFWCVRKRISFQLSPNHLGSKQ